MDKIVRSLEAPLRRAIGAPRIGLAFEGFGVAHAHLHLIPVYRRGDLDPRRATTAAFEDLRPIAERIRNEISGEPSLSQGGMEHVAATS
jgi:diadenosine tetraphosphate (Ap4A) HIT family hydrolase